MLLFLLLATAQAASLEIRVASKSNTIFDTWDYKCDESNDHVEIQKAINDIRTIGKGTILLSDGLFSLSNNIVLYSNINVIGKNSVLKLANNASRFRQAGMIRGFQISNITLQNFVLDGNRLNQSGNLYGKYGFYCEVCKNVTFQNVTVKSHYGYGIDPHGEPGKAVYSDGFNLLESQVFDNGWDGITIDKTINTVIRNNIIYNNGRHGINVCTGSKNTTIENNTLIDNGFFYYKSTKGCGIVFQNNEFYNTSYGSVKNNRILNSATSSICIRDTDHTEFVRNFINGTSNCMRFQNSSYILLNSNICANRKTINIERPYDFVRIINQTSIKYV